MADDVASFFKSKKSKKQGPGHHGLSATVQTPDALVRRLERTVQQQQVVDRENGVEEDEENIDQPRHSYTQQLSGGGGSGGVSGGGGGGAMTEQNVEDSEWLDIQEQHDIDLAKIGIKEMELREESDEEANEEDESLSSRKTWNIPGQPQPEKTSQKSQKVMYAAGMDVDDDDGASADEKPPVETHAVEAGKHAEDAEASKAAAAEKEKEKEEAANQPARYVPPSQRNKQFTMVSRSTPSSKQPNLEDSMEFPSLAAAGELEAEIEKTKKKKHAPAAHPPKKAWSPAPAPVSQPAPTTSDEMQKGRPAEHVAAAETEPVPTKPTGSAYVPPHLRKRGGAS